MHVKESEIDGLAHQLVEGLIEHGSVKAKAPTDDLIACVVELMSANFEIEAQLDDEADKMAEELARKNPGTDATRLRAMIKQRLADKKNFPL